MRRIGTAMLALIMVLAIPAPARAETRADWWRSQATAALDAFWESGPDATAGPAFGYGKATIASADLYGWQDPRTLDMLAKLRATRNPDGGYGISRSWDAFRDGTVNPATASYVVTISDHAGVPLLAAYRQGLVPREEIQTLVNLIVRAPRVNVSRGQCLGYSLTPNDTIKCVHNINAGAGWFLHEAALAGFSQAGMHRTITDITIQELATYNVTAKWWPYADSGALQDTDHNAYSAASMYRLAYWVGREAIYNHMTNALPDNAQAPLAHAFLASTPGGPASKGLQDPTTTLWCEMSDRWQPEQEAYGAGLTGNRAAQYAAAAAAASVACA